MQKAFTQKNSTMTWVGNFEAYSIMTTEWLLENIHAERKTPFGFNLGFFSSNDLTSSLIIIISYMNKLETLEMIISLFGFEVLFFFLSRSNEGNWMNIPKQPKFIRIYLNILGSNFHPMFRQFASTHFHMEWIRISLQNIIYMYNTNI